jgi:hypothetical protein
MPNTTPRLMTPSEGSKSKRTGVALVTENFVTVVEPAPKPLFDF